MSPDTAWLVLTVILVAGAAGSFARWLLDKPTEHNQTTLRVYLVMGITFMVLAICSAAFTLVR